MFELGPSRITKELLLSHHSEEEYMAFYTGVNPNRGLFLSPIRQDKSPTASYYRNKGGELILKDFGGEGFHGNFISVVMRLFNVTYASALNTIANDFGIIKKPNYTVNEAKVAYNGDVIEDKGQTVIQCEIQPFSEENLKWWLTFGITEETLNKFKVFAVKHVFINGNLHTSSTKNNPIYGYYFGTKDGIEQWKIYFPKKKSYRFLLNTNALQGLKQLPKECDYIVVTKSLKDVMALYELGIPAVAPQAESVVLTEVRYKSLLSRCKYLITNGDWDRAGQIFMLKSRKLYKTYCLSFVNKSIYGKDISDFVSLHGKEKALNLIEKIKKLIHSGRIDYQLKYCKSV